MSPANANPYFSNYQLLLMIKQEFGMSRLLFNINKLSESSYFYGDSDDDIGI